MQSNILTIAQRISNLQTFSARSRLGNRGDLIEVENNQIIKADKVGEDSTHWEFQVLVELEDLKITPQPNLEEGVFGHPNAFQMEKIDEGTTLEEYLEEFILGSYPDNFYLELCQAVGQMLNQFWEAGWIHGDLHAKNIVIDIDKNKQGWQPYIIDFGTTFHNEADHPLGRNAFAEKERAIVEELPDAEDDLNFLDSAFTTLFDSMGLGDNSTYWSGLRMLKNQVQAF